MAEGEKTLDEHLQAYACVLADEELEADSAKRLTAAASSLDWQRLLRDDGVAKSLERLVSDGRGIAWLARESSSPYVAGWFGRLPTPFRLAVYHQHSLRKESVAELEELPSDTTEPIAIVALRDIDADLAGALLDPSSDLLARLISADTEPSVTAARLSILATHRFAETRDALLCLRLPALAEMRLKVGGFSGLDWRRSVEGSAKQVWGQDAEIALLALRVVLSSTIDITAVGDLVDDVIGTGIESAPTDEIHDSLERALYPPPLQRFIDQALTHLWNSDEPPFSALRKLINAQPDQVLTDGSVLRSRIDDLLGWADEDTTGGRMERVFSLDSTGSELAAEVQSAWVEEVIHKILNNAGVKQFGRSFRVTDVVAPQMRPYLERLAPHVDRLPALKYSALVCLAVQPHEQLPEPFDGRDRDVVLLQEILQNGAGGADAVFDRHRDAALIRKTTPELWRELGISELELAKGALIESARELWPNISLGVARWYGYLGGPNDEIEPRIVRATSAGIPDSDDDKPLLPYLPICLVAQEIRKARGAFSDAEFESVAAEALTVVRSLRLLLRGDSREAPALSVAAEAAFVVAAVGDPWMALKPLLLAFRVLPEPVLGNDLKVVDALASLFPKIAGGIDFILRGMNDDEKLAKLRRDLAIDLAGRLKPNKKSERGDEPVEPDPVWREAYLRALVDLGIKQTGKQNYVTAITRKVAENDLSADVRNAARETTEILDRQRSAFAAGSHKRLLYHAWWWIRQAHMLSLGRELDDKEANRTRNTEFR